MKKAIIGAGGCGRDIKYHILDNNPSEDITFFVDEQYLDENTLPLSLLNVEKYEVIVAIGSPIARKQMVEKLPKNINFFTFIHKSAIILDKNIIIGKGSMVYAGCILTTNITIGEHCHLNLSTTISHDAKIGDYVTTSPGVRIAGSCNIGNNVYIGMNSSIREKINICDNVLIGLNSGVVKNIYDEGVYGGVPAKKIK